MPLVVPRYTLRDLESFPDDGSRYELLDGVLLVTPGPAPLHELVASTIVGALNHYLQPTGLARVFSRGTLELEPNVHLEPDILVVPRDERCIFVSRPDAPGLRHDDQVTWHPPEMNHPLFITIPELFLP